ncbi:ABC transporter permease [Asticcacaulis sp. BYS171W]|uniref:ABC transporter permease n=1 Tax=Asticcacaulis aquaticus TaxID=2984212 RepID=A0ABT5HW53_9CAUL|nr:ABC transporter permease [Asticcacaulis aquaticus]MDC7684158.1 ABC transporter permease [Asticcacaulis aquaticus]
MSATTQTTPAPSDTKGGVLSLILQLRTYIALIAVLAFFSFAAPNFLSVASFTIMLQHIAIIAILGIGMSFVILTGGIDLSVGSTAGLAGMVAGMLILNGIVLEPLGIVIYPSIPLVIAITLAVGALVGLINGALITRFGVAPFIATLGMLYVARGSALLSSNGTTFPNLVGTAAHGNTGFPFLGAGQLLGVPVPIWLMIVIAAVAMGVAGRTAFGRYVYAIGGSERAATLAGVRVNKVKTLVYIISGLCAALVGLIISSQLVSAHPATGETLELSAIAAVVLGGASLSGGRGTILGTLIGACVIGVLSDGMIMMGVSEFWQMVIKGSVIVAAVVLDQIQKRFITGARS